MKEYREFLTDRIRQKVDFSATDQAKGIPAPPVEKPVLEGQKVIPLPDWSGVEREVPLSALIRERKSIRNFNDAPLSLEELSYLLWATQGVRKVSKAGTVLRNVPSAGNRHSFETYLSVLHVVGLDQGVYRYLPLSHALVFEYAPENQAETLSSACLGQDFGGYAPVTFLWTCVLYRTEWRYAEASYKVIALDAGHVCQNLYLAATAIDCGTCAIGAYLQGEVDQYLRLDPEEELTVYIGPVGKLP